MKRFTLTVLFVAIACMESIAQNIAFTPAKGSEGVCIDTHLTIDFTETPVLGTKGWIRVYDADTNEAVDSLDISIPAGQTASRKYAPECDYLRIQGYSYARTEMLTNRTCLPGTPSHPQAIGDEGNWQLNIIGGFTDGFHFHPVLIRDKHAVIYLHNNMLDYNHKYYVTIDKSVFENKAFKGIRKKDGWSFKTKEAPKVDFNSHDSNIVLTIKADGTGDFCTVQGALDCIPDYRPYTTTIRIAEGDYEELVYARNKTNVVIMGSGMENTRVHYANNEVFNPHPLMVKTNEWPGTFPSRRAAFMLDNCADIVIRDITIATDLQGQAEGLLVSGERIQLYKVHIIGSGDALQANGTIYMTLCELDGGGDTILGRGALYAYKCDFRNSGGPFTWVRNTIGNHGFVFNNCTFSTTNKRPCDYGRTPENHGTSYPNAELVFLNCKVKNLRPQGWSNIGSPTQTMLEYDTRDMTTGDKVDVSKRDALSRQLSDDKDADLINSYRNPAFVLKGWTPAFHIMK